MRLTTKRNGKNVIPLLMAVCGINLPHWRIYRENDLHSYLSGDAADKLAAYEVAEEQGRLVMLPCKVDDTVYVIRRAAKTGNKSVHKGKVINFMLGTESPVIVVEYNHLGIEEGYFKWGWNAFATIEEAEAALKGESAK